jgi:hypothetical protein
MRREATLVLLAFLCAACSSGGSGGGGFDAGAGGGSAAGAGTGGSGATGTGAFGGGASGGAAGTASGGAAGTASGGAGGSSGSAGAAGTSATTPNTPGCAPWAGNCGAGASGCTTKLNSTTDCGACGAPCAAGTQCIGTQCATPVTSATNLKYYFAGRDGVIVLQSLSTSEVGVGKIAADSGSLIQVAVLSGTTKALCDNPNAVAEGADGAIYMSCSTANQIWKIASGVALKLFDAGDPNSNNLPGVAVLGNKLFHVGVGGIFRSNLDGTGSELWMKNACVSNLVADEAAGEIVFSCKYDHAIRVYGAQKPPNLSYAYDREIIGTGNSTVWVDSTHYWIQKLEKIVGSYWTGKLLRVPKQGGTEQVMLDLTPPVLALHVGQGGAYAVQLIDKTNYHMRILRVAQDGKPEQALADWVYGYQVSAGSLFVGNSNLVVRAFGGFVRLPL